MKLLKNNKVKTSESDNGSPEWCEFLSWLKTNSKKIVFERHFKNGNEIYKIELEL